MVIARNIICAMLIETKPKLIQFNTFSKVKSVRKIENNSNSSIFGDKLGVCEREIAI